MPILLIGCFYTDPIDEKQEDDENKVTLKIVNGKEDERYLIEIVPQEDVMSESKPERVITNEKHEAIVTLNADTSYMLFVKKTKLKSLDELKTRMIDEDVVLKEIKFFHIIPTADMNTINIDLKQCLDC